MCLYKYYRNDSVDQFVKSVSPCAGVLPDTVALINTGGGDNPDAALVIN